MDIFKMKQASNRSTTKLMLIFIPISVFCSEVFAQGDDTKLDVPIYTPEEAIKFVSGEQLPPPIFTIDFDGKLKERALNSKDQPVRNDVSYQISIDNSVILEGEPAATAATAMLFNEIDFQAGNMNAANISLLALRFKITNTEAMSLANYARNLIEASRQVVTNEKAQVCAQHRTAKAQNEDEDVDSMLREFQRKTTSSNNELYYSSYLNLSNEFSPNLYTKLKELLDGYVVYESGFDPFLTAIYESSNPEDYVDSFCQE